MNCKISLIGLALALMVSSASAVRFTTEPCLGATWIGADIDADLEKFAPGWKVVDCGDDGDPGLKEEYGGRKNVLLTHPRSTCLPCILTKDIDVPSGKKTTLVLDVGHDKRGYSGKDDPKRGDWRLVVKVNHPRTRPVQSDTLVRKTIGKDTCKDGWTTVNVDLTPYAGKSIQIHMEQRASGWNQENGAWSKIAITSEPFDGKIPPVKVLPPEKEDPEAILNTHGYASRGEIDISEDLEKFAPGWKIRDCGDDMSPGLHKEWGGRKNVLITHPRSTCVPCVLTKDIDVTSGKKITLVLEVGHDFNRHEVVIPEPVGDWDLIVRVNGDQLVHKLIGKDICDKDGWTTVNVDLTPYAGKSVHIHMEQRATGWGWETGAWSKIAVISE